MPQKASANEGRGEFFSACRQRFAKDALGHMTESQYDERNRAVAVYAPPVWNAETGHFVRPMTQSGYDALGQVLTVTDPQEYVTTKIYDRAERNWKVIAPCPASMPPWQ